MRPYFFFIKLTKTWLPWFFFFFFSKNVHSSKMYMRIFTARPRMFVVRSFHRIKLKFHRENCIFRIDAYYFSNLVHS